MSWLPFKKSTSAGPPLAGMQESVPRESTGGTDLTDTHEGDSTDPLGSRPSFYENIKLLAGSDSSEVALITREGYGRCDRFMRLRVKDTQLAALLRSFLLDEPESLTGFRDLLADDLAMAAALEYPAQSLVELHTEAQRPFMRVGVLRDGALWLSSLLSAVGAAGIGWTGIVASDIGCDITGWDVKWRFTGWDKLHVRGQAHASLSGALRAVFSDTAELLLSQSSETNCRPAVNAAESLLCALREEDDAAQRAALLELRALPRLFGASDTGKRRAHNEDAFLTFLIAQESAFGFELNLAAVADGMGGHAAGEVASSLALDLIRGGLSTTLLMPRTKPMETSGLSTCVEQAVLSAASAISARAALDPAASGMGTTLAGIATMRTHCSAEDSRELSGNDGLETGLVFWTGDSRIYLFASGRLSLLSKDHSFVQQLVDAGQLDPEAAWDHPQKNIVTRCLGGGGSSNPQPELLAFRPGPGELCIVCSDGLSDALLDVAIEKCCQQALASHARVDLNTRWTDEALERTCKALIDAANEAGGPDNISVVLFAA